MHTAVPEGLTQQAFDLTLKSPSVTPSLNLCMVCTNANSACEVDLVTNGIWDMVSRHTEMLSQSQTEGRLIDAASFSCKTPACRIAKKGEET